MSIRCEILNMHALMLRTGASDNTARAVAIALYRELVPGCGYSEAAGTVDCVISAAKESRAARKERRRRRGHSPERDGSLPMVTDFLNEGSPRPRAKAVA